MRRGGFTLLEVLAALAILALSLMAIFDLNAGAVSSHAYVKRVTVATFLARSKMTDIEQDLYDKGFPADDEERSGDFSDEGFSAYKWRAKILAPKPQNISTDQFLMSLLNMPAGGSLDDLMSMFGGSSSDSSKTGSDKKPTTSGPTAGLSPIAGAMAGMAQTQLSQLTQQIAQVVREVDLTISWKDGKNVETVDVATHVVSMGTGGDRNGTAAAAPGNLPQQPGAPGTRPPGPTNPAPTTPGTPGTPGTIE